MFKSFKTVKSPGIFHQTFGIFLGRFLDGVHLQMSYYGVVVVVTTIYDIHHYRMNERVNWTECFCKKANHAPIAWLFAGC